MNRVKKPLALVVILCVAVTTSILATWLNTIVTGEPAGIEIANPMNPKEDVGRRIDWDSLPDEVIAWVEVPGTNIDEPIVQASPDVPNAYLYEDALRQGAYGTPYIDCDCTIDSRFVMVYGHHMSDGTVFADFAGFIDVGYAQEHDEIIVYKRTGEVLELEPVAVDVVNASHERILIDQEADWRALLASTDLVLGEAELENQMFAFVTCSYQTRNSRTIVLASQASVVH